MGIGREVAIAAVTAATATVVTALITHWLTKDATIQSVAKGETTLPPGATPKTDAQTTNAGSNPAPTPPNPMPNPISNEELTRLAAVATAKTEQLGWIAASWRALQNQ